jgi:hypothetical protein
LTFCSSESFLRLLARLRHPKAKRLCFAVAFTPRGIDFYYDTFVGRKKTYEFDLIRATPLENTHLPSGYYETLARSYDERFYRQEVLGEFLSLQGGSAYYAFDRSRNVDESLEYDPACRLVWALDFNISPMCSVIGQIRHGQRDGKSYKTLEAIDEIVIRDANVDLACQAFVERSRRLLRPGSNMMINVYGDAAGQARSHAGKSDWQMVREYMARWPEYKLNYIIPSTNPAVKDRVAAVNGALYNAVGETKLRIHPRCNALIEDCERVLWKQDSNKNTLGELDKSNPMLKHISDACGYWVGAELPLANKVEVSFLS